MTASKGRRSPLIVHVIINLDVGGLENGLVNLINRMPARYRQVIVCLKRATNFRERIARDDVQVIAMHKRHGNDPANYVKLWKLLRSLAPDIVHTRNLGAVDSAFPAKLAGVRRLVHGEHGWDMVDALGANWKYRMLRRICAPLIDVQIAVTRNIAAWLENDVGIPRSRIRRIYNGVDTTTFHPAGEVREPLPAADFAAPGDFVIGTVGRMVGIKDPQTLVRAFIELAASRSRLKLVMIGDGELYEDVKLALAEHGLEAATWLPGRRDDIPPIMRGLDLFVLPSRNEGMSNTILEAMATGLPVVATNVGGNPELVIDGETGRLVPPGDSNAMAAAIRSYLDAPAMARMHGVAARRRAATDFSMDAMLKQYLEVYDSLLPTDAAASA